MPQCGHIEDVVVDSTYRGKNFGLKCVGLCTFLFSPLCRLIEQLKHISFAKGCYKVILDCSQKVLRALVLACSDEQNVPFYEKTGFKVKEVQMVLYKVLVMH